MNKINENSGGFIVLGEQRLIQEGKKWKHSLRIVMFKMIKNRFPNAREGSYKQGKGECWKELCCWIGIKCMNMNSWYLI